jgi:hypothetical protein
VRGNYAVSLAVPHGKGAFAVRHPFVMRISPFSKKKSVLFFLLLMFIS